MAKQIESGMCSINDWGIFFAVISSPFGGCKQSGFGKFNGPEGIYIFLLFLRIFSELFFHFFFKFF